MSDEIDQGCENEQRDRDLCIAVARMKSDRREIPANETCHNCLSVLPAGLRYCDKDCSDDHRDRLAAEKRRWRGQ